MDVTVVASDEEMGRIAADRIQAVFTAKPNAVLGVATGSSPMPIYAELIDRYRKGELSFAQSRAFMLDEYIGLPLDHPERYRNVIETSIAGPVDFPEGAVQGPNGNAEDPEAAAAQYDASIKAAGGVDIQILGIGSDGHIAFNEPGGALDSRTHVGVLTEQTRRDNARFFVGDIDQVPTHCMTQGLGTIMEARSIVLVAQGEGKAQAIRDMIEGPISEDCPASVLQNHPDVLILVDQAAASKLTQH